jgi:hypothetical protein
MMYTGEEVENPKYDEQLSMECRVPTSAGIKEFTKGSYGVDFTSVQQDCSAL